MVSIGLNRNIFHLRVPPYAVHIIVIRFIMFSVKLSLVCIFGKGKTINSSIHFLNNEDISFHTVLSTNSILYVWKSFRLKRSSVSSKEVSYDAYSKIYNLHNNKQKELNKYSNQKHQMKYTYWTDRFHK